MPYSRVWSKDAIFSEKDEKGQKCKKYTKKEILCHTIFDKATLMCLNIAHTIDVYIFKAV